jgi:8-oxo-dGTP pyrophosphatase MutT (NUDIX family)
VIGNPVIGNAMAKCKIIQLDVHRRQVRDAAAEARVPSRADAKQEREKSPKALVKTGRVFYGFSTPAPFLTEMMQSAERPEPSPEVRKSLQSGVLAYKRTKNDELRILLVSRKRSKDWGIPKGNVEPYLTFAESAAKEAFEEAGVLGRISPYPVGVFRARKRLPDSRSRRIVEVWIYLLEVAEALSDWPEKRERRIKWVSCEAAARQLREPVLAHLCHRLAQS